MYLIVVAMKSSYGRTLVTLALASIILACGGGGNDNSPPPQTPVETLPVVGPETTGPLTDSKIQSLALLGRIWGFVKYHHPAVAGGAIDWDAELIRAMPVILDASSAVVRNAAILEWLERLGTLQTCVNCASPPQDPYFLADLDWIDNSALLGDFLSAYLRDVYDNRMRASEQRYVGIASQGTPNPIFVNESEYAGMLLPNGGFRLLALFRLWNIIEYWFPYRDIIGEPWLNVLYEFIPPLYDAQSRADYVRALLQVFARINDTHANLWGGYTEVQPPLGNCRMPVNIRFIEGSATISGYTDTVLGPASGLDIGDVILEIDGGIVSDLIEQWSPYYPASNEPTRLRDIANNMTRGACRSAELRVQRGSNLIDASVERVPSDNLDLSMGFRHDLPGNTFQMLRPDVAYIKLSSVKVDEVEQYINDAQGTVGMVIDIRNYPNEFVVFELGSHLVNTPQDFARFTMVDLNNPGAAVWFSWVMRQQPRLPYYDGRIAILVDEVTQSQAEYTTMAFRIANDVVVIGSTTAGADGNVSDIPLPGNLRGLISGLGVFYPDKSPTQRIGIIPDIVVEPTIAGISEGRDEVLDRAIEWIFSSN